MANWLQQQIWDPDLLERRVSIANGLLGLGAYVPIGGSDGGVPGPPLQIHPGARLGNSLNVDPYTGRLR